MVDMDKILFTADDMEKCFQAGEKFAKDVFEPAMGEYILPIYKEREANEAERSQEQALHKHGVNCCALLDKFKQYRKEQQELCEFSKNNGHPKSAAFDEGGLNACDKLIAIIEKHCS